MQYWVCLSVCLFVRDKSVCSSAQPKSAEDGFCDRREAAEGKYLQKVICYDRDFSNFKRMHVKW